MSAVIATRHEESTQTRPWYRYGWPWFLISIPLTSVCLGSVMLYLAFNANNSLVVDDYYKEGKAYNLRIERDRLASLLGLEAVIMQSSEGVILELEQGVPAQLPPGLEVQARTASEAYALPESIVMRWVHVTQAERDGIAQMTFIGANRYIAQDVSLPTQGKFRLHLEPVSSAPAEAIIDSSAPGETDWRLISDLNGFDGGQDIRIPAPVPEKVFNRALLK